MTALYLAPMEEVTGYLFRRVLWEQFGGVNRFFTPFLSPIQGSTFKTRQGKEINPENNAGMPVVPQILTNDAAGFLHMTELMADLGYREVNLNLGCPSGTVVRKGRGSGFLRNPEGLERFFSDVFSGNPKLPISVKTRLGFSDAAEWPALLDIYNRYPISELIVHARVQKDLYGNVPNWKMTDYTVRNSKAPVCYNGDVCTKEDYDRVAESFPDLKAVMIGRGAVANPGIFRELTDGRAMTVAEQREFHDRLYEAYVRELGAHNTLFKMKELWGFMGSRFPEADRERKEIRKAETTEAYLAAAYRLLR